MTCRINHSFFRAVDTEEKAYWLGFIAADGSIVKTKRGLRLSFNLARRDEQHLWKLKDALGFDGKISYSSAMKGNTPCYGVHMTVGSHEIINDLVSLGITPHKGITLQPWNGPHHLMRHFWRGLFDGDGAVFKNTRGAWIMNCCGSESCMAGLQRFITSMGVAGGCYHPDARSPGLWYLDYSGIEKPQNVARILYEGATVFLDRKMEKVSELLSTVPGLLHTTNNITLAAVISSYTALGNMIAVAEQLGVNYSSLMNFLYRRGWSSKKLKSIRDSGDNTVLAVAG